MSVGQPKILCLFSAPLIDEKGDTIDALDIEAERDAIVGEISACNLQVILRIGFATVDELARGIKDDFNILHFSGHGSKKSLAFEDGKGGVQSVGGAYLKKLIGAGGAHFGLAMISACHSEPIAKMIHKAGVRHVVAIRRDTPILDRAATTFAGVLHRHLFNNDTVQYAFDMAKLLVEGNPELAKVRPVLEVEASIKDKPFIPEEKKFLLLPRGKLSFHQKPLFRGVQRGVLTIEEVKRPETNLPVRPKSFRGRSREMHEMINKLLVNRLVTVTGVGGIGKTTAAVEATRWFYLRGHFPHGIFVLNLREATKSTRIIDLLGSCVERQFAEIKDVIEYLHSRHMLLVLDNVEGVLFQDQKGAQDLINGILRFAPNTKLLLTSQRPVGGVLHEPERVCRLNVMNKEDSARLFLATSKRSISKEEWESKALKDLLDQLGGHPLSIVLMARQLTHGVTIEELNQRINTYKAEAIVVKGISDRDPEHGESLVATLASSYNNLNDSSKELFVALSMLPAGAQKFTIHEIFGKKGWEYAQELNDASLAEITKFERIVLLPPVRLFAENMLTGEIRERYGPKIVEVMSLYAMESYRGIGSRDSKIVRSIFTLEEPNFRLALRLPCAFERGKEKFSALGVLATALTHLYILCDRQNEAKEIVCTVVSTLRSLQDHGGLADLLHSLGVLAFRMNDLDEAKARFEESLKICRETSYKAGEANVLGSLGDLAVRMNDLDEAKARFEESLKICREIDEKLGEAKTLATLGDLAFRMDDLDGAKARLEESLKICRETSYKLGEANVLESLGDLAVRMNDLDEAKARLEESLKICRETGYKLGEANALKLLEILADSDG